MNKQLLLLVGFLVLSTVNAQENPSVEKNQFKINVLLPGVVYEHGFDEKHTLYSELSTGFGIQTSSTFGTAHAFYPAINEQFRHYYNLGRRSGKGKVTANNSGGFVALNAIYNFKAISSNELLLSSRPAITIAPVWGFQRTYKGNFNLALNAGVGYQIRKYNNRMATVLNFSLGWVIK
ncbi:hypothetical protein [Flavobacterium muglaense]|uniref:DUF3575 domain-containing protein n=1 Tax=Flavobacterium muglaense TaxID=2764716 RepID=A0A923SGY5_9FLAO|nr:hypothetical protein [Flavobacterium muglaense]MBC5839560.1 hypothetical protein [Flavobacterium muglaense]MBC5846085.1 hypothetical protein [Flavobacterium muglaense]